MCKKVICMVLCIVFAVFMIPSNTINVWADEINNEINIDDKSSIDNNYKKIHFYFNVDEHTTIDNDYELAEAISSLKCDNF